MRKPERGSLPASSGPAPPADQPLPCPACGYDLRGHGDTWVQCPECGRRYERRVLLHEASPTVRALRRYETLILCALAGCMAAGAVLAFTGGDVFCFLLTTPLAIVIISLLPRSERGADEQR